jgi:hypothetical protein
MGDKALEALLTQSREWNTQHQLTGVLLYSEDNIMQVLEGPKDEVFYIFEKIARDARHRNVTKLADGSIQQRHFSQWSMGFKAVAPDEFNHLAGYLNISQANFLPPSPADNDSSLHSLLTSFVPHDVIRF